MTMTTTAFHVHNRTTAERVGLHLTGRGWSAQSSDDRSWTHLRVTHDRSEATQVNQAVLAMDPHATTCDCDQETLNAEENAAVREALIERAAELNQREARAHARDLHTAARQYEVDEAVSVAEERDSRADARDSDAERRDRTANLDDFVRGNEDPKQLRERQRAGGDRLNAKADRIASAVDRSTLSNTDPSKAQDRPDPATPTRPTGEEDDEGSA